MENATFMEKIHYQLSFLCHKTLLWCIFLGSVDWSAYSRSTLGRLVSWFGGLWWSWWWSGHQKVDQLMHTFSGDTLLTLWSAAGPHYCSSWTLYTITSAYWFKIYTCLLSHYFRVYHHSGMFHLLIALLFFHFEMVREVQCDCMTDIYSSPVNGRGRFAKGMGHKDLCLQCTCLRVNAWEYICKQ